jgi:hypothetical protein
MNFQVGSSHFPGLRHEHPPLLRNCAMLAGEGGSCYITVLYYTDFKCYTHTHKHSIFYSLFLWFLSFLLRLSSLFSVHIRVLALSVPLYSGLFLSLFLSVSLSMCYCSLSLWRVARGRKRMFLELIHGLFIT